MSKSQNIWSQYRRFRPHDLDDLKPVKHTGGDWVARVRETGTRVYIRSDFRGATQESFERQLSFYSLIRHPMICPILGFIDSSDFQDQLAREQYRFCLVTEYFPNGSVYDMHGRRPVPAQWDSTAKSKVIFGVAAAMSFVCAKEANVRLMTRDIMLDENFEPILMPKLYGLEEWRNCPENDEYEVCFTPPKELQGEWQTNAFAYQFPWIVYFLFKTKITFGGQAFRRIFDLCYKLVQRYLPDLDGIPDGCRYLIEYLWDQSRYSACDETPNVADTLNYLHETPKWIVPGANFVDVFEYEYLVLKSINAANLCRDKPTIEPILFTIARERNDMELNVDPVYVTELERIGELWDVLSIISPAERMDLLQKLGVDLYSTSRPTHLHGLVMIAYAMVVAGEKKNVAREICNRTLHCSSHVIQYLSCYVGMNKFSEADTAIILQRIAAHGSNGNPFCMMVTAYRMFGSDIIELPLVHRLLSRPFTMNSLTSIEHLADGVRDFHSIITFHLVRDGCHGPIHIAIDKETMQTYAVKSIEGGDVFKDTLDLLMWHPCLINIHGFSLPYGDQSGRILLDYAVYGSLLDQMKRWAVEPCVDRVRCANEIKFWVSLSICRFALAMRALHSRGIIHRDLSLSHILFVKREGLPCLVVAGLENRTTCPSRMFEFCQFAAPELSRDKEYDNKVDIYAFAMIAKEMIKIAGETSVKPAFSSLLMDSLDDNPKKRPTFAHIFNVLSSLDFNIFETLASEFIAKLHSHMSEMLRIEYEITGLSLVPVIDSHNDLDVDSFYGDTAPFRTPARMKDFEIPPMNHPLMKRKKIVHPRVHILGLPEEW